MKLTAEAAPEHDKVGRHVPLASGILRDFWSVPAPARRKATIGDESTHNPPETRVSGVGGLVHPLELGHLVFGVDEAVHRLAVNLVR
jgi:hypothetical protein